MLPLVTGTAPLDDATALPAQEAPTAEASVEHPITALEKRRQQLLTVLFLILVGVSLMVVVLSFWEGDTASTFSEAVNLPVLRVIFIGVLLAFCAYVWEKDRALRRLTRELVDERVLTGALANRVSELRSLSAIASAANSVQDTPRVLETILDASLELLDAPEGAVLLLDRRRNTLRPVTVRVRPGAATGHSGVPVPAETLLGEGLAGWVAQTRQPVLLDADTERELAARLLGHDSGITAAMCVPLLHRQELLGVMFVLDRGHTESFNEYGLRALGLVADNAAVSISNARLIDAERAKAAELRELDRRRADFVSTISHELRSPLSSIIGASRTLARRDAEMPPDTAAEFVGVIERQGDRLVTLIEELLLASRLEAGQNTLRRDPVVLGTVIREVVAGAHARPGGTRVRFAPAAPEDLTVTGDRNALTRVLTNLVDNALKYAPGESPVTVSLSLSGGQAAVSVSDNGPGIAADDLPHIFDRFRQVSAAPAGTSKTGVGLGLYITANLVDGMGGRIWVRSEQGRGTSFTFALPVAGPGEMPHGEGDTSYVDAAAAVPVPPAPPGG
jgi:signal transduction histidine kinase